MKIINHQSSILISAFALLININASHAESSACTALLQDGVFNTTLTQFTEVDKIDFHRNLCTQYKSSGGSSGGFSFKGVTLSANQTNAYGKSLCDETSNVTYSSNESSTLVQFVDQTIVKSFVDCLKADEKGVEFTVNENSTRTFATFGIVVQQLLGTGLPKYNGLTVTPTDSASCQFTGYTPAYNEILNPGSYEITCYQREPSAQSNITISLNGAMNLFYEFSPKADLHSDEYYELKNIAEKTGNWLPIFKGRTSAYTLLPAKPGVYMLIMEWSYQKYTSFMTITNTNEVHYSSWGKGGVVKFNNSNSQLSGSDGSLILEIYRLESGYTPQ